MVVCGWGVVCWGLPELPPQPNISEDLCLFSVSQLWQAGLGPRALSVSAREGVQMGAWQAVGKSRPHRSSLDWRGPWNRVLGLGGVGNPDVGTTLSSWLSPRLLSLEDLGLSEIRSRALFLHKTLGPLPNAHPFVLGPSCRAQTEVWGQIQLLWCKRAQESWQLRTSLTEVTGIRWPALVWLVQESGPGVILGFPRSLPESEDESCFMNSTQLER